MDIPVAMSSDKIYYTDVLEAQKRFDRIRAERDERKRVEGIRGAIPQGHNSGLDADMVDGYHADDLLQEVDDRISRVPKRGAVGGGGGFPTNLNNWEDLRFPVSAIRLGGAAPATAQAYRGGEVLSFASNVSNYVYLTAQIPHSRIEDSNIRCHIHWLIPVGGMGGGAENVKWDLTYSWANIDGSFPVQTADAVTRNVASDPANKHLYSSWKEIDGVGKEASSMMVISVKRDVTVANDYASAALLLEFDIHFKQDKLGTDVEFP